jgi:hypothetical protein
VSSNIVEPIGTPPPSILSTEGMYVGTRTIE